MDNSKIIKNPVSGTVIRQLGNRVQKTLLEINSKRKFIFTVTDFPITDPWSQIGLRPAIKKLCKSGFFKGGVMELGIGDGRNIFLTGKKISEIIGIDVEEWRLSVAKYNFDNDSFLATVPTYLFKADAVNFLDEIAGKLKAGEIREMPKRVIMILPQSLGGKNSADRYRTKDSYQKFGKKSSLMLRPSSIWRRFTGIFAASKHFPTACLSC